MLTLTLSVRSDLGSPNCFDQSLPAVVPDDMGVLAELVIEVGKVMNCIIDGNVKMIHAIFQRDALSGPPAPYTALGASLFRGSAVARKRRLLARGLTVAVGASNDASTTLWIVHSDG